LDWGQGIWQQVRQIHKLRNEYVHRAIPEEHLFAQVEQADKAISVLRDAIHDLYFRLGIPSPEWIDDDENPVVPKRGLAHLTVTGARGDDPNAIRITYIFQGREYEYRLLPPGTDPSPFLDELIRKILVPVSAVRAYRGDTLFDEVEVRMRGS
jgi:hypothetical protein